MPAPDSGDLFGLTAEQLRRFVAMLRHFEGTPRNAQRQWEHAVPPNAIFTRFLTKNDSGSTWTAGSSVTINIYVGATQGSETSNGNSFSNVYVRLGDIPVNAWAYVASIGGKLEVWNAGPSC